MELFFLWGLPVAYYSIEKLREGNAGSLDGSAGFCFKDLAAHAEYSSESVAVVEVCDVV
jgi:hypothetical protein